MRRGSIATWATLPVAALLSDGSRVRAHGPMEGEKASNLGQMVERSNLVFVGDVVEVAYRKARIEGGEGELPYTIVTYKVRDVLRGKAPGGTFTMRFAGGSDGRGRFVEVTGVPVFQLGEQDVLFASGNGEKGCPLVECEWGRFRVLKEGVYNTHGSPVRGLVKLHAIARGLPPEEFRKFSYAAPSFDELIKNPEVEQLLKAQNLTPEEARRRYESEAPKQIQLRTYFPEAAGGEGKDARGDQPPGESPRPVPVLGPKAVALDQFLSAVKGAVAGAKRAPLELKSVNPNAEIVVRLAPRIPARLAPPKEPRPTTPQEKAELEALKAGDFNPVIKR